MDRYGYIYIHKNIQNGHVYIGQSTQSPERRFRKGAKGLNAYKTCPAFFAALTKYGWENFNTEIVAWANTQEELNALEEKFINLYNSADGKSGYNTVTFSEGRGKQSDSTKQKIREQRKVYLEKKGCPLGPAANRKLHKDIDGTAHKHCYDCDVWKPLSDFGGRIDTWDKLITFCKACNVLRTRKSREISPRIKLTPEELTQSYQDRKDKIREAIKQKYLNDPEYRHNHAIKNKKVIIRTNEVTGETKEYESGLAVKTDGFDNTYVSQCCTGKRKSFRGYKWEFKKETGPKDPAS